MYARILAGWLAGKFTADKIDLFVHTGWITHEQGEAIKAA
jgi:hypothetical protein